MKPLLPFIILASLGVTALADHPYDERLWSGANGKTFRGTFVKVSADGKNVDFIAGRNKPLTVALSNLIPADQKLILDRDKQAGEPLAPNAGDPAAFKASGNPNRSLIPDLSPKHFGGGTEEPTVDALWVSLLWWEQSLVLEVPKKGDFERKAEWLHKELTRGVGASGNSTATLDDAQRGMQEYFLKNYKEVATCRTFVEKDDLSAARLGRFCQGSNAVILKMSMTYANGRDFAVSAVLESITGEGNFVVHVFGKRFTGSTRAVKADGGTKPGRVEWVFENRSDLPDHYATNGAHFYFGGTPWNGALVLKPYVYLIPGKPSPLPPDEELAPAEKEPVMSGIIPDPVLKPRFPLRFTTPVEVIREWCLVGGRKFHGFPVARKGDLALLKNLKGQQIEVTEFDFLDDDRAQFCFWEANLGTPQSPPRLDLTYLLKTPRLGSHEVRISAQGALGRVEIPGDRSLLIFDMSDGAFVVTRIHESKGKDTVSTRWGRFEPGHLLPSKIYGKYSQDDLDRFARNSLPISPKSQSSNIPSRYMRFPLPVTSKTLRDPEIDFVLIEQPTVLAGLFQLLRMQTAGDKDHSFVFSHGRYIPWHKGCDEVFPILAASRMMPVRIAWVNASDESHSEENRMIIPGDFSIELTRAALPDAFPEGQFAIPQAARIAPLGTSKSSSD